MDETMNFPDTWEEFVEEFGFSDSEEEDIEHLTEELHDVITLATSELDYLQWSIYGRLQKQKGVNAKNRKRGYWK